MQAGAFSRYSSKHLLQSAFQNNTTYPTMKHIPAAFNHNASQHSSFSSTLETPSPTFSSTSPSTSGVLLSHSASIPPHFPSIFKTNNDTTPSRPTSGYVSPRSGKNRAQTAPPDWISLQGYNQSTIAPPTKLQHRVIQLTFAPYQRPVTPNSLPPPSKSAAPFHCKPSPPCTALRIPIMFPSHSLPPSPSSSSLRLLTSTSTPSISHTLEPLDSKVLQSTFRDVADILPVKHYENHQL